MRVMRALRTRSLRRSEKNGSFSDSAFGHRFSTDDDSSAASSFNRTDSTTSFDRLCNDLLGDTDIYRGGSPRDQWENQSFAGDDSTSSSANSDESSPAPMGWPNLGRRGGYENARLEKLHSLPRTIQNQYKKTNPNVNTMKKDRIPEINELGHSEVEVMKERYAKLLLGEDMSGGGKGVCTALAISNAITNLSASVFGEIWRLEPLQQGYKDYWRREMDWLLAVTDHIVELVPSHQTLPNGSIVEVMVTNPRSDLQINLPALKKLDAMLLETLESFSDTEFWYAERNGGDMDEEERRQEEKWWLPVPKVPENGLSESARKQLNQQKESVNQILKAALTINAQILSEMDIPNIYLDALPKNAKSCLGDAMYKIIGSANFNPESFIEKFDFSNERHVVELVNRVEAAVYIWHRKSTQNRAHPPHSAYVKDNSAKMPPMNGKSAADIERREILVEKGLGLLLLIRLKFPGLPQTILDISKIQYNKDVGQSILESYSRVLESVASNIKARIDDVIHADDQYKRPALPIAAYILSRSSSNSTTRTGLSRASSSTSRFSTHLTPLHSTPSNLGNPNKNITTTSTTTTTTNTTSLVADSSTTTTDSAVASSHDGDMNVESPRFSSSQFINKMLLKRSSRSRSSLMGIPPRL